MIHPADQDYQRTKVLKRNGAAPPWPFGDLARWISAQYQVEVLNIVLDRLTPGGRPRLNIILDRNRDEVKFREGYDGYSYDKTKQESIRRKFESLLAGSGANALDTKELFVFFSAFERVARIEANEKITGDELERFRKRLNNPNLWTISQLFDSATFFFYTDAQAKASEAQGLLRIYTEEYARLVAPHDEFGYLAEAGILVHFDSKDNFDTNYQSNWYYYYK